MPGINIADGQVSFEAGNFPEAARGLIALQRIAAEGGRPYVDEMLKKLPEWDQIHNMTEAGFWELWMRLETERHIRSKTTDDRSQKR